MPLTARLKELVVGAPRDPLVAEARRRTALLTVLAWAGLGADGLSSVCYGPEEAFLALGQHTHLGLYLAVATFATVFVIALAYNQVIELFPGGGGGYKVSTQLLGTRAGLVSGAALMVDYVLTIAISIAASMDALFSLLPPGWGGAKRYIELTLLLLLVLLNLRGYRETLRVLLPIALGFVLVHGGLLVWGIGAHAGQLPDLIRASVAETGSLTADVGWLMVVGLFLKAYSLGGGTYTGLEAISNNVNRIAEPRVRNGKRTMTLMALTLAMTAGGLILLYLLWAAEPVAGQTLNAVTFRSLISTWQVGDTLPEQLLLWLVLLLEAGLLLVAANTGFYSGPGMLGNMAADAWVPRHFRSLSARLVTQNGVVLMGAGAFAILLWSGGEVSLLIVLYTINVFLTLSLALAGLVCHWWRERHDDPRWLRRLSLALAACCLTSGILLVTTVEKFAEGGWVTVLITSAVIALCAVVRRHYDAVRDELRKVDALLAPPLGPEEDDEPRPPKVDRSAATAIFLVGQNRGIAIHAFLWVFRMFPGHFRNCVFLAVGEVDAGAVNGQNALRSLKLRTENSLHYFVRVCARNDIAAETRSAFGPDPVEELHRLTVEVMDEFPNSVCFASKLIFASDSWLGPMLHNQTALSMQRRMHLDGRQMVIVPLKV